MTTSIASHSRFPNQLFGREQEQQQLLDAYREAVSERPGVSIIEGMPGIGKSALLAACRRSLVQQGALCLGGAFAAPHTVPALHGLALLLEDLCLQLLARPNWHASPQKRSLQVALGPYSAQFVELAPSARRLFGPQLPQQSLPPDDSRNKIVLLFRSVITAAATAQQPMVWFLDDCQWCDPTSAEVVRRLLLDATLRHWCMFGAQRIGSHAQSQTFFLHAVTAAQGQGAPLTRLVVEPLSTTAAGDLLGARLGADGRQLGSLPNLLCQQAMGHPLYLIQSIESLLSAGKLRCGEDGVWQAPADAIRRLPHSFGAQQSDMTAELLRQRVRLLDPPIRDLLAQASYLSEPFSVSLLAALLELPVDETAERVAGAAVSGFLAAASGVAGNGEAAANGLDGIWQFAHEEVRQAVLSLLPETTGRRLRQRVGVAVLLNLALTADDEQIYLAAHYLNENLEMGQQRAVLALPIMLDPPEAIRRLAIVNCRAGLQALRRLDAATARQFAEAGAAWLETQGDPWSFSPSLASDLATLQLQAAYFTGMYKETEQAAAVLLPHLQDAASLGSTYVTLMMAATAREDPQGVDTLLHQGLAALHIRFPRHLNRLHLLWQFMRCRWLLRGVSKDPARQAQLLSMNSCEDTRYVAASRILMSEFLSKQARGELEFLLYSALLGVEWTMGKGHIPLTVIGFMLYTVMLSRTGSKQDELQRYVALTQKLLDRLAEQQARAGVIVMLNSLLLHRLDPLHTTVAPLRAAIELALADGDGQFAADCALVYLSHLQLANAPAAEILAEGETVIARLAICGDSPGLRYCRFMVENCRAIAHTIDVHPGLSGEETLLLDHLKRTGNRIGLFVVYSGLLFRQLLAEDFAAARRCADELRNLQDAMQPGSVSEVSFLFGDSLAQLLDLSAAPKGRRAQLRRVARNQRKLARWAAIAPHNYRYRWLEVEAQRHSALGNLRAAPAFDEAWQCAAAGGFWLDAAGIAELAALHHLRSGDFQQAQMYLERAWATYTRWGSPAKVRILERLFSFAPALAKATSPRGEVARGGLPETLHRLHQSSSLRDALQQTLTALAGALGARRILLLAGNQPGKLRMLGSWTPEATSVWPDGALLPTGVAEAPLPLPVATYVLQAQRPLLIDDYTQHSFLAAEQSLAVRDIHSCWCIPVWIQSRIAGLVYVEDPAVGDETVSPEDSSAVIAAGALLLWENEQLHVRLLADHTPASAQEVARVDQPDILAVELLGRCRIVHAGVDVTSLLQERLQLLVALMALSKDGAARSQLGRRCGRKPALSRARPTCATCCSSCGRPGRLVLT